MPSPGANNMARWQVYERKEKNILTHLMKLRGFSPSDVEDSFELLHDPLLLPDMDKAVELIIEIKKSGGEVVIFGDYDADGTPGAALLSILFDHLKIPHKVIIPTRAEGYGLKKETIEGLGKEVKLLITVDNGIRSVEEVKLAKKLGIKTIILDHHLPGKELPPADAVVDQYLPNSKYPFMGLCGCALSYKLVCALEDKLPELNKNLSKWLLDLVAISTVADMMPLTGENRQLVRYGLKVLRQTRWPGLQALLDTAGVDRDKINETTLGFVIGPRLNATGRMGDNQPALDLLLSRSATDSAKIAREIERINQERQRLVEKLSEQINKEIFVQNSRDDLIFVIKGKDWPLGVLGLVAGKLCQIYSRPVIVLSEQEGNLTGSGRSIKNYSLIDGLTSQEKYLARFGGHRTAAGLSLKKEDFENFVDGLKKHATQALEGVSLEKTYIADAILDSEELAENIIEKFSSLSPFGYGNPSPKFILREVGIISRREMGKSGEHLKLQAKHGDKEFEVVIFGNGKEFPKEVDSLDMLGALEINKWRDKKTVQLRLVDYRTPTEEVEVTALGEGVFLSSLD